MRKKVCILGGGFAGLAAAVNLAEAGFEVSLFERRPLLGGRAYSVTDSKTGEVMDNGQHLFMGCYHHTFEFLKKIGSFHKLHFQSHTEVYFSDPQAKDYSFICPSLPFPFHFLGGLLRLGSLCWTDKWRLIRLMQRVRRLSSAELAVLDQLSCEQWLILLEQSPSAIAHFWEPLTLATLNETLERSSAEMLAVVLREALLKGKMEALMVFSKVGLSELYTEEAKHFIEARGGKIFLRKGASQICLEGNRVQKIVLEDGQSLEFDFYLSALPPDCLMALLKDQAIQAHPYFTRFSNWEFSPILGINLWFDQPILDKTFTGLLHSPIHWVFNKAKILNTHSHYLSLVVSGAHELKDVPSKELTAIALEALYQALPASRQANLLHSRILKELKATPSFGIDSHKLRPEPLTPVQNLFLAGDWTDTGLPATIEGAVKSGKQASERLTTSLKISKLL